MVGICLSHHKSIKVNEIFEVCWTHIGSSYKDHIRLHYQSLLFYIFIIFVNVAAVNFMDPKNKFSCIYASWLILTFFCYYWHEVTCLFCCGQVMGWHGLMETKSFSHLGRVVSKLLFTLCLPWHVVQYTVYRWWFTKRFITVIPSCTNLFNISLILPLGS